MTYATDGKCHNAEPGTHNHECGKPAEWIGQEPAGYKSGFCSHCKEHGYEAKTFTKWTKKETP
jgi:hypothetical protein